MAWGMLTPRTNDGKVELPVGVSSIGKSEVELVGPIGALRKTPRSFVGMPGTQINSQPAIHGQSEAAEGT
eukprot:2190308-Pleurochrysis_carterae.AAC.1